MAILSDANLIFFPGIAADQRTFEYMRPFFPNLYAPPWLPLETNEPLHHYVLRLADSIPQRMLRPPFYLGGHSFGGVLAQEMATLVRPNGIFLIASLRSHQNISPLFKWIERLTRWIPNWLLVPAVAPYRYIAPVVRRGRREQLHLLVSMFYETPLELTRWGAHCATAYTGSVLPPIPVYQIHGSKDPVLPVGLAQPDVIIPGGTHLIPITHATDVARFVAGRLGSSVSADRVPQSAAP